MYFREEMMDRRQFLQTTAAGSVSLAAAEPVALAQSAPKKALMKLGTQHSTSDDVLKVISAFGVNHICSGEISPRLDDKWSVEGLTKLRERVESHGIKLEAVPIPLPSSYITKSPTPSIMLAGPPRDQDIDNICQMIRNCAKAGIPMVKYNMTILGVVRTESTPGRGSARYSTFEYAIAKQDPPLTEAGRLDAGMMWGGVSFFFKRVV